MATETVLDYLGHPCQIAEAKAIFEEPLKEARDMDVRHLVGQIGGQLNGLGDRHQHVLAALNLAYRTLVHVVDSEDDGELAVLTMAISYQIDSINMHFNLAGKVLAALERGKLVEVAHA